MRHNKRAERLTQILARWLPVATDIVAIWLERLRIYRLPLIIGATLLFCGGAYYSFLSLGLSPARLDRGSLALLACLMLPSLFYGGLGLSLLAWSAGLSIPIGKATTTAAYASLSEILPVPGGAIIRASALMKAGGSLPRSSALVLLTAILWIALAMTGAGLALLQKDFRLAIPMFCIGALSTALIFGWLWVTASATIAIYTLLHRSAGIALMALRLQFSFAILHTSIDLWETTPFALASIMGSASSIAPAGLGVSESLAALAATVSAFPPGIAFLAVGIDRLTYLLVCGCIALLAQLRR